MMLPVRARGAIILLFGAVLVTAVPARASDTGTLWLNLPDCATPPYRAEELLHALDVELSPDQLRAQVEDGTASHPGPRAVLRISRCDPRADSLTLRIWSTDGAALGMRSLELDQIEPAARARTVALLITDALRPPRLPEATAPSAAERELESNPFGPAPSAGPTVARAGPPVHDDALLETGDPYPQYPASSALLIGVGLQARLLARDGNLLLGFELSARGPLLGVTEWAVEGSYSEGDTWTPLQELELNWWNGAVGIDFIAADSPRFSLGPRLAVARVAGETSEAVSFGLDGEQRALVMTLGARANLSARLWRSAAISATLEISHSLYETPLTEQGEYLPWYGWALTWGVGVSFGL